MPGNIERLRQDNKIFSTFCSLINQTIKMHSAAKDAKEAFSDLRNDPLRQRLKIPDATNIENQLVVGIIKNAVYGYESVVDIANLTYDNMGDKYGYASGQEILASIAEGQGETANHLYVTASTDLQVLSDAVRGGVGKGIKM